MARCSLCHEERDLRDSHVISEFFYKPVYDEKHRFHVFTAYERGKERPEQKGFRERLLCQCCESKRAKWETYAADVLFGARQVSVERQGRLARVEGLEYAPFKLFLMSNLWIAGVAQTTPFQQVRLGPAHSEALRRMLHGEDPGAPGDYPCLVEAITLEGKLATALISKPIGCRIAGHRGYRFVCGGFLWAYKVSKHPFPRELQRHALNEQGQMWIIERDITEHRWLLESFRGLTKRYDSEGRRLPAQLAFAADGLACHGGCRRGYAAGIRRARLSPAAETRSLARSGHELNGGSFVGDGRFTPQARRLWEALDESTRHRVLSSVWCAACGRSVSIANCSGRVVQGDVVLSGVCQRCAGEVSRLVETGRVARNELIEGFRPLFIGEVRKRTQMSAGARVRLVLTAAEGDLVTEHAWGSEEIEDALGAAVYEAGTFRIEVSLGELDELMGWIAAAANHEERRAVQKRLERLYGQLRDIEELCTLRSRRERAN